MKSKQLEPRFSNLRSRATPLLVGDVDDKREDLART